MCKNNNVYCTAKQPLVIVLLENQMSIYKLIITHLFIQLAHTVILMELNKSSPPNNITTVVQTSREIYIQPCLKTLWQG